MSTPNILADIYRIEDLSVRQAAKSLWDAVNAARAETANLQQQISALQQQDAATAAQLATLGVEGLASIVQALVTNVNQAIDHPYLVLSHSTQPIIPSGVVTSLPWDTEQLTSGGTFHDVAANNDRVYIGRKPGIWLSVAAITFDVNAVGQRQIRFDRAGGTWEYHVKQLACAGGHVTDMTNVGLLITRGVNDPWGAGYVNTTVYQDSGAGVAILRSAVGGSVWGLYYLAPLPVGQRLYT